MKGQLELREVSFKMGKYLGCSFSCQEFIIRGRTLRLNPGFPGYYLTTGKSLNISKSILTSGDQE